MQITIMIWSSAAEAPIETERIEVEAIGAITAMNAAAAATPIRGGQMDEDDHVKTIEPPQPMAMFAILIIHGTICNGKEIRSRIK